MHVSTLGPESALCIQQLKICPVLQALMISRFKEETGKEKYAIHVSGPLGLASSGDGLPLLPRVLTSAKCQSVRVGLRLLATQW